MRTPQIRTLDQCMDIFDWFDDPRFVYHRHIWLTKCDASYRLANALPEMIREAKKLVRKHRGREDAYPEWTLNIPA